jgi:hypothetical protein
MTTGAAAGCDFGARTGKGAGAMASVASLLTAAVSDGRLGTPPCCAAHWSKHRSLAVLSPLRVLHCCQPEGWGVMLTSEEFWAVAQVDITHAAINIKAFERVMADGAAAWAAPGEWACAVDGWPVFCLAACVTCGNFCPRIEIHRLFGP